MISIEDIIHFENNFARSFAEVEERDYGLLFHNRENLASHDSNHALILNLEVDLDAAIADVSAFYRGLGVEPRVNHGFLSNGSEALRAKLLEKGFQSEAFEDDYYVCSQESVIRPVDNLELRRVHELDDAILGVLDPDDEWTPGVLKRQISRSDYHLMVGYASDQPVTLAELDIAERVSRVDGVLTNSAHRGHGYGRALMHGLVDYHRRVSSNALYLYANNPTALKIYHEAGFRKLDWKPHKWRAWLP